MGCCLSSFIYDPNNSVNRAMLTDDNKIIEKA